MSWRMKRELVPLGIILATIILAVVYGPGLPGRVPSHFDGNGYPDDTMERTAFLIFIPGIVVGIYLLLTFIPFIDPLWKKIQPRYGVLLLFRDFTMGFMLMMFIMNLMAVHEGRLSTGALGIGLGILFMLIGNYLPKTPRNWFFGIRTPWTMSSDEVWKRTHIVGGWLFVASGLLTALLSFSGIPLHVLLLITLGPTVLVTGFIYPYLLYRRLQRGNDTSDRPGDGPAQ
jgi:uncharacterized membrane protein